MKIHILTEVWGHYRDEVSVTPYADKNRAVFAFRQCVRDYLEGSDRFIEAAVDKAVENKYAFDHAEGFIMLEETEIVTS